MMIALFPERDIFLQAGTFVIHWYGLLWAVAIWLVWYLAPKLQHYRNLSLSRDQWTSIIAWGAAGALVGGRLGYVFFYEPSYFLQNPAEIFAIWQGGMASHGGFVGAAIAVFFAAKKLRTPLLSVADVLVVPVALALALGRLGNWINLEIFGNNPIAIGKNLLIALVCFLILRQPWVTRKSAGPRSTKVWRLRPQGRESSGVAGPAGWLSQPGTLTAIFFITYGVLRILIEPLRDDPWTPIFGLTRGQLLTLPLLITGVWLFIWQRRQQQLLKKPIAT